MQPTSTVVFRFIAIILLACATAIPLPAVDAVYGTNRAHRFDLGALASTGPKPSKQKSLVLVTNAPVVSADALRWQTSTTEEAFRFPADAPWTSAHWLAFDTYYDADHCGMLVLRFFAKGDPKPRVQMNVSLFPRLKTRVALPLSALDVQTVHLRRTPGRQKAGVSGQRMSLEELNYVTFSLERAASAQVIYVANPALLAAEPDYPVPATTIADELGQYTGRDWPGKTRDVGALKQQLNTALQSVRNAHYPSNWSRYGGWTNKRFKATGFFRTEHDGKRWWLVDPEGCGFFSAGLDSCRPGEWFMLLPGMEKLCAALPEKTGAMAPVWSMRGDIPMVDLARANLVRAFGEDANSKWAELTRGRLVAWRFNTIANWSDLALLRYAGLPYVTQLGSYPTTKRLLFRDFPDVFDPEFRTAARASARSLEGRKNDPLLIGYFLCNEPKWGFGSYNLAAEMLEANPGTATRRELARWLSERYHHNPEAWAQAWKQPLKSFAQIETDIFRRAGSYSTNAYADLWAFSREMVRTWVKIPCEEARRVDPSHLNLGMRFAWIASDLFYDVGEFFDVFSINSYQMEPPADLLDTITRRTGRPVMIGEFHFGALDRGMLATGLRGVASQSERGIAYRRYLEAGAAHPNLVGAHYFILNDQALLGRNDGENYQIGFVDVCHTPYDELVQAAIQAHESLYEVMAGTKPPSARKAVEIPRIK